MKDHPVKFTGKRGIMILCIIPNPVSADIDLALNRCPRNRKTERNNIRIVVMLQKLLIDLKEPLVRAENVIKAG